MCSDRDFHEDTPDIFEGSFMEFVHNESWVSANEKRWLKWVGEVEEILGFCDARGRLTLDGNQDEDGYSLDFAHDAFADGCTPAEYAAEVAAARKALGL